MRHPLTACCLLELGKQKVRLFVFVIAGCLVCAGSSLTDGAQIFDNETDFLNEVSPNLFESFESFDDKAFSNDPILADAFTISPTSAPAEIRSTNTGGHFSTDGIRYISAGATADSIELIFDLNAPATAFGLSITDFGDNGTGDLVFRTDLGDLADPFVAATAPLANGNLIFFGFLQETPFNTVTITTGTFDDGIGVDSVHILNSIPEPNSCSLMVLVIGFGFMRRSKLRCESPCTQS